MFKLSICIPTCNRAPNLELTLSSITSQSAFTDDHKVEVVVVDNCSTDGTAEVISRFKRIFPEKIVHFRNNAPINGDLNILNAIKMGSGSFIKAHNDNFCFLPGSLDYIIGLVDLLSTTKPVIFFTNAFVRDRESQISIARGLDAFVKEVSFCAGWIGGYGLWKVYRDALNDFGRLHEQQIFIVDENFRLIPKISTSVIVKTGLFYGTNVGKKGGYSLAKVFGFYYVNLLKQYLDMGYISSQTFNDEKKKVLTQHILKYASDPDHNFKSEGFFRDLYMYWDEDYFQEIIDKLFPHYLRVM